MVKKNIYGEKFTKKTILWYNAIRSCQSRSPLSCDNIVRIQSCPTRLISFYCAMSCAETLRTNSFDCFRRGHRESLLQLISVIDVGCTSGSLSLPLSFPRSLYSCSINQWCGGDQVFKTRGPKTETNVERPARDQKRPPETSRDGLRPALSALTACYCLSLLFALLR